MYIHIYTWTLDPMLLRRLAPLNVNSSAPRLECTYAYIVHVRTVTTNGWTTKTMMTMTMATATTTRHNTTFNTPIHGKHHTHTLSTLLKRNSLALSPASQTNSAWLARTAYGSARIDSTRLDSTWLDLAGAWHGIFTFQLKRASTTSHRIEFCGSKSRSPFCFYISPHSVLFCCVFLP